MNIRDMIWFWGKHNMNQDTLKSWFWLELEMDEPKLLINIVLLNWILDMEIYALKYVCISISFTTFFFFLLFWSPFYLLPCSSPLHYFFSNLLLSYSLKSLLTYMLEFRLICLLARKYLYGKTYEMLLGK